jgi:uncharacterized protein with PIN domain
MALNIPHPEPTAALAKWNDAPLSFKGNDFILTDLQAACQIQR